MAAVAAPSPPRVVPVPAGASPAEAEQIARANQQNRDEYRKSLSDYNASRARANAAQRGALTGISGGLGAKSILPESPDVRFADAMIAAGVGTALGLFAASRPTPGQRFGWAAGEFLVGTLAFVEGRGSVLRYGGAYTAAAAAAVFGLEFFGVTKQGL